METNLPTPDPTPEKKLRVKSRKVDFTNNVDDMEVIMAGLLGKSTRCILSKTGLSACQIQYRLHLLNVKRADFRNGTSWLAKEVERISRPAVKRYIERDLL